MRKIGVFFILLNASVSGAQYQSRSTGKSVSYGDLRHEIENHEAEIRMFEERLNTQEEIVDSLRQQVMDANHENRELVKGGVIQLEGDVSRLENSVKGMAEDLRQLQTHGNDTASLLNQHKRKIEEVEEKMGQLQATLQLVLDALQISEKEQVYEVVSGDSLEKIARKHNTTIQKIKELNKLSSDRIYIGQKLKMP